MKIFVPTLLEFFSIKETEDDEFDPKIKSYANPFDPKVQKGKTSSPGDSIMGMKKSQGPIAPQPTKKVDPGTEFLRKHGYLKKGGTKLSKVYEPPKPLHKPPYKGQFLGQTVKTHGKVEPKKVAWQDKSSGGENPEWRYGRKDVQNYVDAVWDGEDWVSPEQFKAKFAKK